MITLCGVGEKNRGLNFFEFFQHNVREKKVQLSTYKSSNAFTKFISLIYIIIDKLFLTL